MLRDILSDATTGVQSFLEQVYLRRVERAHGLPTAQRQLRAALPDEPVVYRVMEYLTYDLIVELDGRIGHADIASSWRDMRWDNVAAVQGKTTLRFGYELVGDPCTTASQVKNPPSLRGQVMELKSGGTSTACSRRTSRGMVSRERAWVAASTTGAATPSWYDWSQRAATTHQRSPGRRPAKSYSGLGVTRSLPTHCW